MVRCRSREGPKGLGCWFGEMTARLRTQELGRVSAGYVCVGTKDDGHGEQ